MSPFGVGAAGNHVRDLQGRLQKLNYDPGAIDGSFGSNTEASLRSFQKRRAIDTDGICGPESWSAIVEAGYSLGSRLLYLHEPPLRGDDVAQVQQLLSTLGFKSGHVDGIHTAKTADAITDFQLNAGLTPDGVCGSITLESLKRYGSNLKLGELASLQERDRFNSLGTQLNGKKIVLGETGGLYAIIASLRRSLGELGANVLTIHHPDASAQATQANTYGADLFIALEIRPERPSVCHFQGEQYLSPVGSLLAEKLVVELSQYFPDIENKGMALRILRETQMPTVLCRFDSANTLVRSNQLVASSICTAISNALGKGFTS